MGLSRNLVAGMASSIWAAVIGLAVVPFYLKYLGIESYGLVGFMATLQAIFSLLDVGLASTMNREIARFSATGELREAGNLLQTLATIYWGVAVFIAFFIAFSAPLIAGYWLNSNNLPHGAVSLAVMMMGFIIACRWPAALYQGALMGMQRLALSSVASAIVTTLGNLGAVAILAFVSPTIKAFFVWQACIGLFYTLSMRWLAWRIVNPTGRKYANHFSFHELKRIWRFSVGMSGIAISGVVLMQMDKIVLSKMLGLEDFGRYALAGVIANGLYIMLTPLFNAIYPRMSALVAIGDTAKLTDLYKVGTRLFLALFFPIALWTALHSDELLYLWTRNQGLAASTAPIAALLLIGTALNGAMHFPFALQLAHGATRLPLKINSILLVVQVPITIFLAMRYGVIGGAASCVSLNGIYLFVGTWFTHRAVLKGVGAQWLLGDVVLPLGIATVCVGLIGNLLSDSNYPFYVNGIIGAILIGISFMVNILISQKSREMLFSLMGRPKFGN